MTRVIGAVAAALGASLLLAPGGAAAPAAVDRASATGVAEVRALWVQRSTLTSAPSVVSLVRTAKAAGFNTLIVQVRGRGDAYYVSRLEPRGAALARQHPSFDPLELVVAIAHLAGLKVHAWINVNLISDSEPPAATTHVARLHPEWLMVPRDLAADFASLPPHAPGYLAGLSRYARDHSDTIEGLYLSPIHAEAADYTVAVISDIAARYAIDGIHLDYARFPNDAFDYSRAALAAFHDDVMQRLSPAERSDYEARAEDRPLFFTQMFPERWQEFRRDRMTTLVMKIHAAVKASRPRLMLSAAVWPDPDDAGHRRFQDWRGWLDAGLLDVVCPMAYTTDAGVFRSQIAGVRTAAGSRPVWAGIGAYHLPARRTIENIKAARRLGAQGIVLFSYDNLTPAANSDNRYLTTVGRGAFTR